MLCKKCLINEAEYDKELCKECSENIEILDELEENTRLKIQKMPLVNRGLFGLGGFRGFGGGSFGGGGRKF